MGLHSNIDSRIFEVILHNTTNPGANVQIMYTVPANCRVEILAVSFQYVIFNAGAARQVMVAGYNGTNYFQHSPLADPVAINNTLTLYFATGIDARDHEATHDLLSGRLATNLFLEEGDTLRTVVDNWNAGDILTNIHVRLKRWIVE
jgi:hypothetical protein